MPVGCLLILCHLLVADVISDVHVNCAASQTILVQDVISPVVQPSDQWAGRHIAANTEFQQAPFC